MRGYDNYNGANYNVALWVAYYNFLRPHKHNHYRVLNPVGMLEGLTTCRKWRLLILLGQQTILQLKEQQERRLNLFLDSGPEVKNATIRRDLPYDGTPKQCYHAVTQTVKSYLFLSSSPSVRRSEHCFGVPSRGGGHRQFLNISVIYKVHFTPGSPAIQFS